MQSPIPRYSSTNDGGNAAPVSTMRRLPRSRSAEDLSRIQLKSTESDTVVIFIEYVRKKLDKKNIPTSPTAEVDESIGREQRHRGSRLHGSQGRRTGESLRRLQSEPNGKQDETCRLHSQRVAACHDAESSPRPTRLVLERPPSNKAERRRRVSATTKKSLTNNCGLSSPSERGRDSGISSSATTPIPVPIPPDPPLGISPCDAATADFVSSYPPPSTHRQRIVSSPVASLPSVVAGAPISQHHYCTSQQPLTPQMTIGGDSKQYQQIRARNIAEKLKLFGDDISGTYDEEAQRDIFAQMICCQNPQAVISFFSVQLRRMLIGLSWQNIGKVFHLSYHLIEFLNALLGPSAESAGSPEWIEFSELWDFTLGTITRWISSNGGWSAFPADSTGSSHSSDQHTCPATPSFRRVRRRLLRLSESGEFVDEEGHPHSADTISTTSSETGLSDDREDQMGSSVDLLQDPLEGLVLESSLATSPPHLPATVTPHTVSPPCTAGVLQNGMNSSPKVTWERIDGGKSRTPPSAGCSTVGFSNGVAQPGSRPVKRKNHSVKDGSSTSGASPDGAKVSEEGQLSRTGSLPANAIRRSSARRTSQTALNGLVIGVGGAAVVYAAVSALMRH